MKFQFMKDLPVPKGDQGWSKMPIPWLAAGASLTVAYGGMENEEFVNNVFASIEDDEDGLELGKPEQYAAALRKDRDHFKRWLIKGWDGLYECEEVEGELVYKTDDSGEMIPIEFNAKNLDEFVDMLSDEWILEIRRYSKDRANFSRYVPPRRPNAKALGNS